MCVCVCVCVVSQGGGGISRCVCEAWDTLLTGESGRAEV